MDLQIQKQRLLAQKHLLEESIKELTEGGLGEAMNQSVGELSGYDNHPADLGSEMFERSKDLALRDNTRIQLVKVNDALQELENGEYGFCSECGNSILPERLEALPSTTLCIQCKAKTELPDLHPRPIEEYVVAPPFGKHGYDLEDRAKQAGTGYDGEDAWQEVARFGEHAEGSGAGSYYGGLDLDESRGSVEAVDEIPYFKGADGMFYEDLSGLDDEDPPVERIVGDDGPDKVEH
jgi:YteA family regulatory protein